jgi:hypothetical protein
MAELVVVGFKKDMYRASEVLNTLKAMNDTWVVDLSDAVAVYRDYKGKLRVDQRSVDDRPVPPGRTVWRSHRRPARGPVYGRRERRGSGRRLAERRRPRRDRRRD